MNIHKNKVKIGLIGLGNFGEKYANIIHYSPRMELSAICSRNEARLQEIAGKYGVKNTYQDYRELVQLPDIDAVCIITEAIRHADITLEALKNGKHVFVEKPLSANLEDHDKVIRLAGEKGLIVLVGYINRYIPNFVKIKSMVESGEIGKIVSIASRRNGRPPNLSLPRYQGNIPELIIEPGIHTTDLFLWITGSKVTRVFAESRNLLGLPFADTWMVILKMENGVIGTMEQVFHIPEGAPVVMDHRLEVIGTDGTIQFTDPGSDYSFWGSGKTTYFSPYSAENLYGKLIFPIRDEIEDFASAIQEGRKPSGAGPQDCRAAVEVARAVVESAKSGQVIILNNLDK
ncbi:MAG: Gfo/Idh/MocA family oxidoreductase [Firmicutes bacterium]|nr:Gfo/Idh/MocA family oxidoreductase [Bacillota bacterium]